MVLAHMHPRSQAGLPLAVILSALFHMGATYALLYHSAFGGGPVFDEPLTVKLIDLPAGTGGATEGEVGIPEEPAPPSPEEPSPQEPPKTTLPGEDEPEPEGGPSPADLGTTGRAPGLGHGGPAGLGGKESGMILDQGDFEYAWYKARLEDSLKAHWRKPLSEGKKTVTASVHFVIGASGEAIQVQLVQSSGNPAFDQSVLKAIYDAAPFPRFPPAYQGDRLGVFYTFELLPEKPI